MCPNPVVIFTSNMVGYNDKSNSFAAGVLASPSGRRQVLYISDLVELGLTSSPIIPYSGHIHDFTHLPMQNCKKWRSIFFSNAERMKYFSDLNITVGDCEYTGGQSLFKVTIPYNHQVGTCNFASCKYYEIQFIFKMKECAEEIQWWLQ